jgi:CRISPR-associated endonuclease/helicase Cas3
MLYAHTPNAEGEWHPLAEHLRAVAKAAADFAAEFGGEEVARWAGLLHDLGKASGAFQAYLAACAREPTRRHATVDHKGAGTLRSQTVFPYLAYLIDGHHGGLPDDGALRSRLKELGAARDGPIGEVLAEGGTFGGLDVGVEPALPAYPGFIERSPTALEFFLRMVFSALVDADHADTERHFNPADAAQRGRTPPLQTLAERLGRAQDVLMASAQNDAVNAVRAEVYRACLEAAERPPGFFRLTVPTGGGKTRSGLAFALRHALRHGLRRVVVALPYLTITDQTAAVFREVLGDDNAVLEHHSGIAVTDDPASEPTPGATWRRLAAQDWDAPVVVTTTVQLFESLLGRTPTACRKLHRLAKSVVILDEAQTLPPHLRGPIFDVLRQLVECYGASVVLCTATQPALDTVPEMAATGAVREIAPELARLFRALERVRYEWPAREATWTWERAAAELRSAQQGLAVLNTIADALALFDALDDPDALHLSTLLCGAHRRDVLTAVRQRLARGEPCRVVSTQVVEAGVDLDFPLVVRALGPLDRIVQAAGRCNREGRLDRGRVVVFDPAQGRLPPGAYKIATAHTRILLDRGELDLNHPETFPTYFRRYYQDVPPDREGIQPLRAALAFEQVAERFKLIEEDTASVFVRYRGLPTDEASAHARRSAVLLEEIRRAATGRLPGRARALLRQAQPYLVSVRRRRLAEYEAAGLAVELPAGIWEWKGGYDEVRGLDDGALDPALLYVG